MTKDSLEKIAQSVVQGQSPIAKKANTRKGDSRRGAFKSGSPTPPNDEGVPLSSAAGLASFGSLLQGALETQIAIGKANLFSSGVDVGQVNEILPPSSAIAKRGRTPKKSQTLSSRRSTKESNITNNTFLVKFVDLCILSKF